MPVPVADTAGMREQDLLKQLGRQIARFRKSAGMTQDQLGSKVGLNWKTIGKIERGESFTSLGTLYQIGGVLGRGLDELFAWSPRRKARSDEDATELAVAFIREVASSDRAFTIEDASKLLSILGGKKVRPGKATLK